MDAEEREAILKKLYDMVIDDKYCNLKYTKDIKEIKGDIKELKTHQNYIWDDIKKLDKRISDNTAEINVLKRA